MLLQERLSAQKLLTAVNMLKVIAHPVRLAIVDLLSKHKSLTVIEIQDLLHIEQAIASQHLTLMQDKGILLSQREGRYKYFSLKFPHMKNIITCMENCCQS